MDRVAPSTPVPRGVRGCVEPIRHDEMTPLSGPISKVRKCVCCAQNPSSHDTLFLLTRIFEAGNGPTCPTPSLDTGQTTRCRPDPGLPSPKRIPTAWVPWALLGECCHCVWAA